MAWIERTGVQTWQVRYRDSAGRCQGSGITSPRSRSPRRWPPTSGAAPGWTPQGARTLVAEWAKRWIETIDVEIRTEENYRALLRNHILRR